VFYKGKARLIFCILTFIKEKFEINLFFLQVILTITVLKRKKEAR